MKASKAQRSAIETARVADRDRRVIYRGNYHTLKRVCRTAATEVRYGTPSHN